MATKKVDVSTGRITYGFPGADYSDLDTALIVARDEFRKIEEKYGEKLIERWDTAIKKEDTSIYLNLHIRIEV